MLRQALSIESEMSSVPEVAAKLRALCMSMGIAGGDVMVVELCAVEALASAIEHAYAGKSGHTVEVVVMLDGASLTLEVRDRGRPLPAGRLQNAQRDGNGGKASLGLFIPPSAMDSVSYASADGVNTLTLSQKVHVAPRVERATP